MSIEKEILLSAWTKLSVAAEQEMDSGVCVAQILDDNARIDILTYLLEDFDSVLCTGYDSNELGIHAEKVAKILLSRTNTYSVSQVNLKLEACCLALALTGLFKQSDDVCTARYRHQLYNFALELVSQTTTQYRVAKSPCSQPVVNPTTQEPEESLRHALRSPLQGAMLTLELIRESQHYEKISMADIDTVIHSLKIVSSLLERRQDISQSD